MGKLDINCSALMGARPLPGIGWSRQAGRYRWGGRGWANENAGGVHQAEEIARVVGQLEDVAVYGADGVDTVLVDDLGSCGDGGMGHCRLLDALHKSRNERSLSLFTRNNKSLV
ncbi:hypothetical protein BV908_07760 [Diaphorobacter sp. LR2014-1]|nr:hypothetical protein BV908_07760 [Diaphorobacter sp. LR2014-1]